MKAFLLLASIGLAAPAAAAPVEAEYDEVAAHRIGEIVAVRSAGVRRGDFAQVAVRMIVGADGAVVSVALERGNTPLGDPNPSRAASATALASARTWHYRPFTRNGAAVEATFVEGVPLLPPEQRPARHVAMPPYDQSVRIRLERGGCFGSCPDYAVQLSANGEVVYHGGTYVLVNGARRTQVDPALVRRLYDQAVAADFFSMRDDYSAGITDGASYAVTIEVGGRSKTVVDYFGPTIGMPGAITALERAIDVAARTTMWIEGDDTTVAALAAEGFDLRSAEGARMLAAAALAGKAALATQLADAGAPLAAPARGDQPAFSALASAAQGGHAEIVAALLARRGDWSPAELREALAGAGRGASYASFRLLAARGAATGIGRAEATALLHGALGSGDPSFVREILALDPDVNHVDSAHEVPHPLAGAARVRCRWNQAPPACDPLEVVRLLLAAGADPRIMDPRFPQSPLTYASDGRIARLLIAAGADPNSRDFEGAPVMFSVGDEAVALAMLDAGADPRARRPSDRMTMRRWAEYQRWPQVLARLAATPR